MIFDVREYGAIGNGKTLNTQAIQKAIDDCASKHGGREAALVENLMFDNIVMDRIYGRPIKFTLVRVIIHNVKQ